ncbi:hypothetical protein RV05_GL001748 [Enterococcus hirae]|nr:hypothetical protein RV05_GL001748 [Enterococcus hirae]
MNVFTNNRFVIGKLTENETEESVLIHQSHNFNLFKMQR